MNRMPEGIYKSKLYNVLDAMKQRCHNLKHKEYHNYGARNIQICDEWMNGKEGIVSFYNWAMSNGCKEGLSIDRINVNGNYEPSNCRWANMKVQSNNTRKNHVITHNNKTQTLQQWCEELNIKKNTLSGRLLKGWSVEKALTTSVKQYKVGDKCEVNS